MQIPIINGIYTDSDSDFRTSYPINMVPVPKNQGISQGYLRPAEGIVELAQGTGVDRGAVLWDDVCYRVSGDRLISVSDNGVVTDYGSISNNHKQVTLDYSFDNLGITSDGRFYLFDKTNIQEVTDPDLGVVLDHIWVDGYFLLTDGEFLIVTELNDPTQINPLKYGSSEADPDPVKAILKLRNEPYVLNRYTIEVFSNVGGTGFPFQRIDGAQVQKGVVGTHACAILGEQVAFVGGGREESLAVWAAFSGSSTKISSREVDQLLQNYTENELSSILLESRMDAGHEFLYLHLPDQTLVYDLAASRELQTPVWFILSSGITKSKYLARNFIWKSKRWIVGNPDSNQIGYLTDSLGEHWGNEIGWEFGTTLLYNEGSGAIFHELELVGLTGRTGFGENATIYTQYTLDGVYYSQKKYINAGKFGERGKRLVWLSQGDMRSWRSQKFGGTSRARISFARLQARIEPLAV